MLSAIITKVSSLSLEAFLNKYLFYPIGIYESDGQGHGQGDRFFVHTNKANRSMSCTFPSIIQNIVKHV